MELPGMFRGIGTGTSRWGGAKRPSLRRKGRLSKDIQLRAVSHGNRANRRDKGKRCETKSLRLDSSRTDGSKPGGMGQKSLCKLNTVESTKGKETKVYQVLLLFFFLCLGRYMLSFPFFFYFIIFPHTTSVSVLTEQKYSGITL